MELTKKQEEELLAEALKRDDKAVKWLADRGYEMYQRTGEEIKIRKKKK